MDAALPSSTSLPKSSLTRAAIVVKSLPRWQAVNLLSRIRAEDCAKILEAVSQLDQVTSVQLAESVNKLKQDAERWRQTNAANSNAVDHASNPPTPTPDRRKKPGTIADRVGKPFEYLINTDPLVRQQLLQNEHPRNIAIVLASLPPETASICLAECDPCTRVSVIRRMCEQEELDPQELNELNYILKLRHQKLFRRSRQRSSGMKAAVELLSYIDPEMQRSILSLLEQSEPELAQQLDHQFVSIDDLIELSDEEIKQLLNKVDTTYWAPALKRAAFPLQQKILKNLAPQAGRILSQQISELTHLDPVAEQQAQRMIIKQALTLSNFASH